MAFVRQDEKSLPSYLLSNVPSIEDQLGVSSEWKISEIGDGNLNFVFLVQGPKKKIIAVPYIRLIGESWPLTRDRAFYESEALKEAHKHCPEHVPTLFHFDASQSLMIMEYFTPHIILRKGLIQGIEYPFLAEHMADYMARTLFHTSGLGLSTVEKKEKLKIFAGNSELCKTTEQVIFTDPFIKAPHNHWNPALDDLVESIQKDSKVKEEVGELKRLFQESCEALIHGDLHTGSVLVTASSTIVIDFEFAFYGPIGFDIGAFIANLFLSYFSQEGHATPTDPRESFKNFLLKSVNDLWNKFTSKWMELWTSHHSGDLFSPSFIDNTDALKSVQQKFLRRVFLNALGFAATKMMRRIIGVAHVEDLESIADLNQRAKCERKALRTARLLLLQRESFETIEGVTEWIALQGSRDGE